ncbi:DoxX family protein [Streptomyces albireticuli]|uniref:DoxX family protein n=1 Tax=Streptomyces albireticuli TaxID=1940 RepID=A0A2A2DCF7_9ACTN|nr:DoxX family protein [Streptomyces albireticuli]MCD9142191.1 DoxX family protein [Streptomyces albireticuli]MCD9162555.1 DoxX family protein [Streptomyces albireticuli]MCD9190365.1 DoxX family protein [Streptomyces albireticuli]PAU49204.1 DoxX family protein [Streptomyces albireticuli]
MASRHRTTSLTSSLGGPLGGQGATALPTGVSLGLLLIRLMIGLTMVGHGTQKLFGWFGGAGIDGTGKFFTQSGYPAGKAMAVVAGLSEALGGLGLFLGLLTPLAAAAVLGTMINALVVTWGDFFLPTGVEFTLLIAVTATALALTGPGRYAVDHYLPVLRAPRLSYGVAAIVLAVVAALAVVLTRD